MIIIIAKAVLVMFGFGLYLLCFWLWPGCGYLGEADRKFSYLNVLAAHLITFLVLLFCWACGVLIDS